MSAWEVSNYESYKSVAIMQDGQVIANLNDVAGSYEERLGRASRICDAVNAARPETLAERKERALAEHGVSPAPSVEQTESAVQEASEGQRSETREAGME